MDIAQDPPSPGSAQDAPSPMAVSNPPSLASDQEQGFPSPGLSYADPVDNMDVAPLEDQAEAGVADLEVGFAVCICVVQYILTLNTAL